MTDLTFTAERHGDRAVLTVAGDIDMQTAAALKLEVKALDIAGGTLVLDLSGVGFVDSSGLGALLGLKKQQERAGGRLLLGPVSEPIDRLFQITKMHHVFQRADA